MRRRAPLEDAWQSELKYGSSAGEGHAYVSATLIGTVRGKKRRHPHNSCQKAVMSTACGAT